MTVLRAPQILWAGNLLLALGLVALSPSRGSSQGLQDLVNRCSGPSGTFTLLCHQTGLALEGARVGLGTAATLGSETPGSASTFGHRLRSFPRVALSGRVGLSKSTFVKVPLSFGSAGGAKERTLYVPSLHLVGTVGVLNGFSPSPTVGGVLSLDLLASTHALFPSQGLETQGNPLGWGLGARVGILRESFTLPGVSISATRRWMGSTTVGELNELGPAQANFDLNTTSLRWVVGKDVLGVGLLAGMGWDHLSGDATLRARISPTGAETRASASNLTSKRMVYFAGGSLTFLIVQLSGEFGFSDARDQPLPLEPGGGAFPSGKGYFASLAFRLTF